MNIPNNKKRKKSQEQIEKIFLQLIQKKNIDEISVSTICDKANLNRSTFYSNYIDIYDLAEKIKYEKKYTIKDIVNYNSFNDFMENTVDEMVAGKYAADLLEILYNYNDSLFHIDGNNIFPSVLEMVQRRNLHIHKSGIVDEKYFTKGNGGSLGLSNGDYAIIDKIYYVQASKNLTQLIINIDTLIS